MNKFYLLVISPIFLFAACATTQLSQAGKKVTLVDKSELKLEDHKKLDEIGPVNCSAEDMTRYPDTNTLSCRNELRNKAGELGADTVVIEQKFTSNQNGIRMVGTAYKQKQ